MLRDAHLEKNKSPLYNFDPEQEQSNYVTSFIGTGRFVNADGFAVRDTFMNFFNEEGEVD